MIMDVKKSQLKKLNN